MAYENVLVVDDEEHIVELIKFNLESNGYNVITAYDGEEALVRAKNDNIGLIILDIIYHTSRISKLGNN